MIDRRRFARPAHQSPERASGKSSSSGPRCEMARAMPDKAAERSKPYRRDGPRDAARDQPFASRPK